MISKQIDESASVVRSRVEDVEHLKQHQRCERQGLRVAHITRTVDQATWQTGVEHQKRPGRHHNSDENDATPHAARNYTFSNWARGLIHDVRIGCIKAESQGGSAIRHEINPEDLRRR